MFNYFVKKSEHERSIRDMQLELSNSKKLIQNLQEENLQLYRIIRHYVPGKITGYSIKLPYGKSAILKRNGLYVYKDGIEYSFPGIDISDPIFSQGDKDNIVYVTDKETRRKYVLDLSQSIYIEIEKEQTNEV